MTATFSERAIEAGKTAMEAKRSELQHLPLARIYGDLTQAALTSALAVDGLALVPKEPTQAMIIAGCENNPTQWNEGTSDDFASDVANDIYVAMVRTAASDGEVGR